MGINDGICPSVMIKKINNLIITLETNIDARSKSCNLNDDVRPKKNDNKKS